MHIKICVIYTKQMTIMCEKSNRIINVSEPASVNVPACLGSPLEQITGVEPASSVWETEIITAILYLHFPYVLRL